MANYGICVMLDVDADSPEEAYTRVYKTLAKVTGPGDADIDWSSTDEWFVDGELMTEDAVSAARSAALKTIEEGFEGDEPSKET